MGAAADGENYTSPGRVASETMSAALAEAIALNVNTLTAKIQDRDFMIKLTLNNHSKNLLACMYNLGNVKSGWHVRRRLSFL